MSLPYVDINQAINANGLRLIVVQGMPSAWGIAVRGMIEYKSLDFTLGPQKPMGENPELLAWSGTNSGPVVAWNDEKPINRWDDILVCSNDSRRTSRSCRKTQPSACNCSASVTRFVASLVSAGTDGST